eukprot:1147623-Pelagomonas_calceolata.AAC.6
MQASAWTHAGPHVHSQARNHTGVHTHRSAHIYPHTGWHTQAGRHTQARSKHRPRAHAHTKLSWPALLREGKGRAKGMYGHEGVGTPVVGHLA